VIASQALHVTDRTDVAAPLRDLLALVRSVVPPVIADRVLGGELLALSEGFTAQVYGERDR
jgi:histidine ammonia-lyase